MAKTLSSAISKNTKTALSNLSWQIENISLLLNKYLDFLELENEKISKINDISFVKVISYLPLIKDDTLFNIAVKKVFEINERKGRYKISGKEYEKGFVIGLKNGIENYRHALKKKIYPETRQYVDKIINIQTYIADEHFTLKTSSRLIIGLGSGTVLETSIKLHHIYGVPYIPSSAIKGVLRAYRIWKLANWNEEKFKAVEKRIEENKPENSDEEKIIEIFGNQKQKGKLIILDAYPTNFEGFDIDIMNVHYPDYYSNEREPKPPADWQNPNPIIFLTIPKGTEFNFYFKNTAFYDKNLKQDLKEALEYIGIGAKTSLGYGTLE